MAALTSQLATSEPAVELITDNLDVWTSAIQTKSASGRGSNKKIDLYGIKKLRELILELAVQGKLVPQDSNDEPASVLLEQIEVEKAQLVKEKKIKKPKALPPIADDERPFDLPIGWKWTRLGSIGFTQTGGTPKKTHPDHFGTDIPFIKPADIQPNGVEYNNEGLSFAGEIALGRTAPAGSILMVCIGTIGKCYFIDRPCTFNQQINSVTPFTDITAFIFRALSANYFQNSAWALSSSTTIAILNKGKWESLAVPLPPLSEQHRIVAKVDELMALCDKLEQQTNDQLEAHETLVETLLGTLTQSQSASELSENWARLSKHFDSLFTTESSIDKLKQTILQLAVMGRLVEQNPNDEPASVLLKKIAAEKELLVKEKKLKKQKPLPPISEDEKPFELPTGWEWCRFGHLFRSFSNGLYKSAKFYTDAGVISLRMYNIQDGDIDFTNARRVELDPSELEQYRLREDDLLINRVNSKELVGKTAIIPYYHEPLVFESMNMRARPFADQLAPAFLNLFMKSSLAKDALYAHAKEAIGQASINQGQVSSLVAPLPPQSEQQRIVAKVDQLMTLCDQLKDRLKHSNETRCQLADALVSKHIS
jgi:type I restriction enzyme S subunit